MCRTTGRPASSRAYRTSSPRRSACWPTWTTSTSRPRPRRPSTPPRPRGCSRPSSSSNPTARTENPPMRSTILHGGTILGLASLLTAAPTAAQVSLTGAGATFPNPIYTKWFDAYNKKTGVQINYQSIGSGGGIRQFTEGTVDFGATDGPMNESQIAAVNANVLHVPTVLGAVVVTYNLPSLGTTKLKLDGNVLVDIFMGRITNWNDKRIA